MRMIKVIYEILNLKKNLVKIFVNTITQKYDDLFLRKFLRKENLIII